MKSLVSKSVIENYNNQVFSLLNIKKNSLKYYMEFTSYYIS